jgi:hypothetical protein
MDFDGTTALKTPSVAACVAFDHDLGDALDAERQTSWFLRRIAECATSRELCSLTSDLRHDSGRHVRCLANRKQALGGRRESALREFVRWGTRRLEDICPSSERDLLAIALLQQVYEWHVSTYERLCNWSTIFQEDGAEALFRSLASEHKTSREHLAGVADSIVLHTRGLPSDN